MIIEHTSDPARNAIQAVVWVDHVPHFIRRDDHFSIDIQNQISELWPVMTPAYKFVSGPMISFAKNDRELFLGNAYARVIYRKNLPHYVIEPIKESEFITLTIINDIS
jgi:hypothetical protein